MSRARVVLPLLQRAACGAAGFAVLVVLLGADAARADPADAAPPPAAAASASPKVSPHARAALQRAAAGDAAQQQGSFTLFAHGMPHRPASLPHNP